MIEPVKDSYGSQEDPFEAHDIRVLFNFLDTDLCATALKVLVRLPLTRKATYKVAEYLYFSLKKYLMKKTHTSEEKDVLSQLSDSAVYMPSEEIRVQLHTLLEEGDDTERKYVAYALSKVRDLKALSVLLEYLDEPEKYERMKIAYHIAYHDVTSVSDKVHEFCLSNPDGDVRFWLAIALAKIGLFDGLLQLFSDAEKGLTTITQFHGDPYGIAEEIRRVGGLPDEVYSNEKMKKIIEEDSYFKLILEEVRYKPEPYYKDQEKYEVDEDKEKEAEKIADSILADPEFDWQRLTDSETLIYLPKEYSSKFITKLFKKIVDTYPHGEAYFTESNEIMDLPSKFWGKYEPEIISLYQLLTSLEDPEYGFRQQIIWTMTRGGLQLFLKELLPMLDDGDIKKSNIILEIILDGLSYIYTRAGPTFGGDAPKEDVPPKESELIPFGFEHRRAAIKLEAAAREDAGFVGFSTGARVKELEIRDEVPIIGVRARPLDIQPSESERCADFAFYDETKDLIKQDQPLEVDTWYYLEVAVRMDRIGVQPETEPVPFKDPTKGEPVEILVSLESSDFDIQQPVQTLILPPKGDSTENAWFKVRPKNRSAGKCDRSEIRVRMFYNLYLIEVARIKAEIVRRGSPLKSRWGLEYPITFRESRLGYKYGDFEKIKPRAMNIDITKENYQYVFTFTISGRERKTEKEWKVENLSAPVMISESELKERLKNARNLLEEITMSKTYKKSIRGDKNKSNKMLRELADEGRGLWIKLFKGNLDYSISKIGKFLQDNPIEKGGIIQISVDPNATDFVFPWSLLFDGEIPSNNWEAPDPEGFWGIRYVIEQKIPDQEIRGDIPVSVQDPLSFNYFLWPEFPNAKEHTSFLLELEERSNGRIDVNEPPITDISTGYRVLSEGQSEIFYFYTHGFIKPSTTDIDQDFIINYYRQQVRARADSNDPDYDVYKKIYDDFESGENKADRSWIKLGSGILKLNDLKFKIENFKKKPIVILNMCCSAQILPTLSDNFVDFFIWRGAISVLGTECPMTPLFAYNFIVIFLQQLLQGETTGNSLLYTRRHFMNLDNPIGLAYTLYGSATVHFSPNLL